MADSFYIHLPSDSSLDVFPDNTISRFTTKLAKPVDLDGPYEVGLSEIIYPTNYYNIDNRSKTYKFWIRCITKTVNPETQEEVSVEENRKKRLLRSGNYRNLDEFLTSFHKQINDVLVENNLPASSVRFVKEDDDGKIMLVVNRPRDRTSMDGLYFMMSPQLSSRLGYEDQIISTSLFETHRCSSKNNFELNMGKNLMYVYSDIISHCLVGDVSAPLLRASNLPVSTVTGAIHLSFPDVHYKPVQKSQFDTIDIHINSDEGLNMSFLSGKVLVTLHFRRLSSK